LSPATPGFWEVRVLLVTFRPAALLAVNPRHWEREREREREKFIDKREREREREIESGRERERERERVY
jgi:hypothetical protein